MSRDARRRGRALGRDGSSSLVAKEVAYRLDSGRTKEFDVRLAAALGSWAARSVVIARQLPQIDMSDIAWLATGLRSASFVSILEAAHAINSKSSQAGWWIEPIEVDALGEQRFFVWVSYAEEAGAALTWTWREARTPEAVDQDLLRIGYDAAGWWWIREQAQRGDRLALAALAFLRIHSFDEYCWLLSGSPRTDLPVRCEGWHEVERHVVGRLLGVAGRQEKPWLDSGGGWRSLLTPRSKAWTDELGDAVPAALWWLERGKKARWTKRGTLCAQAWSNGHSAELRVGTPRWPAPSEVCEAIFVRGGAGVDAEGAILLFYDDGATLRVHAAEMRKEGALSHGEYATIGWSLGGRPVHVFDVGGTYVETREGLSR